MKVFVVLKKVGQEPETHEEFSCVRTTLPAAMVAAYGVKPAVVLEVPTKPKDGLTVERAEVK